MNRRLPYEEELAGKLNDLPLPDENAAWSDMQRRLEKNDDDPVIPFWLNGCLLWSALGILFLALGWWIIRPEKWLKRRSAEFNRTVAVSHSLEKEQDNLSSERKNGQDSRVYFDSTLSKHNDAGQNNEKEVGKHVSLKKSAVVPSGSASNIGHHGREIQKSRTGQLTNKDKVSTDKNPVVITNPNDNFSPSQHQIPADDTLYKKDYQNTDTIQGNREQRKKESLPKNKLAASKTDSLKSLKFSFAAGLSLHQQLPINGQKFVPYNLEGRKGTIADYIPSVYVRAYQKNKWFIQSEFRYGAPQYTKEFVYQQEVDTNLFITTTKSTRLNKTYYNQLPLTFHYHLSKRLSVGTGIMWNKFVSAISSQDVVQHNNITGLDSTSKGTILVSKAKDSGNVFVKSWFQVVFDAEYKWKKFSFGAKYSIGLQPYIKFELPGAAPTQERNNSLDIFIRYELWRSKK